MQRFFLLNILKPLHYFPVIINIYIYISLQGIEGLLHFLDQMLANIFMHILVSNEFLNDIIYIYKIYTKSRERKNIVLDKEKQQQQ